MSRIGVCGHAASGLLNPGGLVASRSVGMPIAGVPADYTLQSSGA